MRTKRLESSHLSKKEQWSAVKWSTVGVTLVALGLVDKTFSFFSLPHFLNDLIDVVLAVIGAFFLWTILVWVGTLEDERSGRDTGHN